MKWSQGVSCWTGEPVLVASLVEDVTTVLEVAMHERMSLSALHLRSELLQRQLAELMLAAESISRELEDCLLVARRKHASEEETQATEAQSSSSAA